MSKSNNLTMNKEGMVTDEILNNLFNFPSQYQPNKCSAKQAANNEHYAAKLKPKYVIANKNQLIKNAIRRANLGNY